MKMKLIVMSTDLSFIKFFTICLKKGQWEKLLGIAVDKTASVIFLMTVHLYFTTRTPAITDVFVSGRNVGALRPACRVPFR